MISVCSVVVAMKALTELFDLYGNIFANVTDRFRRHGSRRSNPIPTQNTSQMSLPTSQSIWLHRKHPVHHSSISHQLPRVTNCRTLSRFHITVAVTVSAATLVTCQPQILSLRQSGCCLSDSSHLLAFLYRCW